MFLSLDKKPLWLNSITTVVFFMVVLITYSCGDEKKGTIGLAEAAAVEKAEIFTAEVIIGGPPEDLKWLTNNSDPLYASPLAKKGGTFRNAIKSFPLTFRTIGPDSNTEFRGAILGNQLSLTGLHPNTMNIIPELATHWAFGKDKKTMYFKLNPSARWSDGKPVTAHDFAYTLEFMRSKHIVAPWYNDYYTKEIDKVLVYDDHTLAVVGTKAQPDLHLKITIGPTPRHFYGQLDKNFVRKYNWKIVPNTGPYQISDLKKGKYVKFKRKRDWWARDLHYFKNRFNVNNVIYTVVRDDNLEWEYFKKGRVDVFDMTPPKYWHVKSRTPVIENGYVNMIWFYNDTRRSPFGLYLNQDKEIFKDINVRYAFAHAMNIQKVIEKVLRNDYFRLQHGFVGYGPYSNNRIKAREFDLEKVDHYMEKAGWKRGTDGVWAKNGRRFTVEILYGSERHTPKLVVLKEEARKAGIELELQKLDPSTWYTKISESKHEAVMMGFGSNLRPSYWQSFHSDNAHKARTNNVTNTDDPELDKMIEAYRNSLDEQERIQLSHEIQEKVHKIGAFVPTSMVPYIRRAYWRWWRLPEIPGTKESGSLFGPFSSATGGLFWYDKQLQEETKKAMKKKRKLPPVTIVEEIYRME